MSAENDTVEEKLARLAAYERMHADVARQYAKYAAQVDERKAAGAMRGATGNQLLAQKMTYKNILGMYELYDLNVPDTTSDVSPQAHPM